MTDYLLHRDRVAIDVGTAAVSTAVLFTELNPGMFFPTSPSFWFDPTKPHRGYMYSDIVLFVRLSLLWHDVYY